MHLEALWGNFYTSFIFWNEELNKLKDTLATLDREILAAARGKKLRDKYREMLISAAYSYKGSLEELKEIEPKIKSIEYEELKLKEFLNSRFKELFNIRNALRQMGINSIEEFEGKLKEYPSLKTLNKRKGDILEEIGVLYRKVQDGAVGVEEARSSLTMLKKSLEELERQISERKKLESYYKIVVGENLFSLDFKKLERERLELEGKLKALEETYKELLRKQCMHETILEENRKRLTFYRNLYIEAVKSNKRFYKLRWKRKSILQKYFDAKRKVLFLKRIYSNLKGLTLKLMEYLWEKELLKVNENGLLFASKDKDLNQFVFLLLKLFLLDEEGEFLRYLNFCC